MTNNFLLIYCPVPDKTMNEPVIYAGTFPQPFPQFRIFKGDAAILFLMIKTVVLQIEDFCHMVLYE